MICRPPRPLATVLTLALAVPMLGMGTSQATPYGGLSPTPSWSLVNDSSSSDVMMLDSAPAGDVNGDGFDDVLVLKGTNQGMRNGYLLRQRVGPSGAPHQSVGERCFSVGDVNGDGFDDLLGWGASIPRLMSYPHYGTPAGIDQNPGWSVAGRLVGETCGWPAPAGDVNGDGFGDILVSESSADAGVAYLIYGGAGVPSPTESGHSIPLYPMFPNPFRFRRRRRQWRWVCGRPYWRLQT